MIARSLPTSCRARFADHQRLLARRVTVVAAWISLLVMPVLVLLEYMHDALAPGMWWTHTGLRAVLVLGALFILALRWLRPAGRWPRPAALLFALALTAVGWAMLLLHYVNGSEQFDSVVHSMTIAATAVAVMATGGARDLLLVYGVPVTAGALALWWIDPVLTGGVQHLGYPMVAMLVGAVIAELLFRGYLQAFAATRRLEQSATTDPLTGLLNRRGMDALLRAENARSVRHRGSYAVLMADLDHFKRVNDTHGHDVGDQVLQELGTRLRGSVRTEDQVARWGGEEFLVLLPGADEATAWRVAEKIRRRIGDAPFATSVGALPVSISLGASVGQGQANFDPVVRLADQALYQAKGAGRNRTVLAGAAGSQPGAHPETA